MKSRFHSKPQSLDLSTDQDQRSEKINWYRSATAPAGGSTDQTAQLQIWDQNQLLGTRILPGTERRGDEYINKSQTCYYELLGMLYITTRPR